MGQQNPIAVAPARNPSNKVGLLATDAMGNLLTGQGSTVTKNITAATVVKAAAGRLCRISVIVAGSAAGGAYDQAVTAGPTAATQIASIPNTLGVIAVDMPVATGILIVPGTGQTLAVSFA